MHNSRHPATVVGGVRALHVADIQSEPHLALAAVFGVYAVVLLWITLTPPLSGRGFLALSDVLGFLPPFAAGGFALLAASRSEQHVRQGWLLLGLGAFAWGAGDVIWTVYEVILQRSPFPSAADAGYLTMLPLVAVGLIILTSERQHLARARPTLDGLVLVLSVTAVVWLFVLRPIYGQSSATLSEKVVSAAYPIGDLVVTYALVVAVRQSRGHDNAVLATLLAGMGLLVATDVYFAYLQVNERYSATSVVNVGWPYAFMFIAYAAALGSSWPLAYDMEDASLSSHDWKLAGALAIVPGFSLVAAVMAGSPSVSVPLYVMAGIASIALVARLAINFGLTREVEAQRERLVAWFTERRLAA